jgi:site-specific DNA-methyltransferase (adenine-specific)
MTHYEEYQKTGDINYFEEVIDAMVLDGISGMNDSFKNAISNLSREKKRMTILSLLDKDLNLFKRIKALTDNSINKMDHIKDVILMLREYVKVGEVEKKKYGEVMTPLDLVKEMLATLPEDVWSDPNLKWLDPANGTGPYPIMVVYKLMNGLKEWEPDDEKRYKHIIENMIYVCELQPKNMFLYMCAVDPFDTYKLNIYTGSFLEEGFDKHMKDVWNVEKFDIVMGNPPYQEMDGGAKASARPIYNLFTEKSIKLSDKITFITPSRWFGGGKGLDSYRRYMMDCKRIKSINHFDDASVIFGKSVEIKGGVSYFLFDNKYSGNCLFNLTEVDLSHLDVIVSNTKSIKLLSKFLNTNSLKSICHPRSYFGIDISDKRLSDVKLNDDYKICYVSKLKGYKKWIDSTKVCKPSLNYRVVTPRAATKGGEGFGNIFISIPGEYLSDSYISFYTKTLEESNSLLSYLNTKFANHLLSLRKVSQTVKGDTCKWIPMVPLDREWTDEKLFEYFNLSEDEIKLILEK